METVRLSAVSLGSSSVLYDYTKCTQSIHWERRQKYVLKYLTASICVYLGSKSHSLSPCSTTHPCRLSSILVSSISHAFLHTVDSKHSEKEAIQGTLPDRERLVLNAGPTNQRALFISHRSADAFCTILWPSSIPDPSPLNGQTCECLCVWCDGHDEHDTSHHMLLLSGLTGRLPTAFMPVLLWGLALCRQRENSITA